LRLFLADQLFRAVAKTVTVPFSVHKLKLVGREVRKRSHKFAAAVLGRVCQGPQGKLEEPMSSHIYKVVELVGSSPEGIAQAVEAAVEKAAASLRNLRWFEVVETRGQIENGKVRCYQVTLKVGFTLEDS
jgi:flavin-binding protein dodecin